MNTKKALSLGNAIGKLKYDSNGGIKRLDYRMISGTPLIRLIG
ncbi:hypothetical protein [Bradyrhizobium sp. SSUT77]|nr:hypothetical protein [Bradyrhizobium sp. SSUT77]MDH2348745.1 hypothetical protein [Bradyrhizobium sp. SSUT77]